MAGAGGYWRSSIELSGAERLGSTERTAGRPLLLTVDKVFLDE